MDSDGFWWDYGRILTVCFSLRSLFFLFFSVLLCYCLAFVSFRFVYFICFILFYFLFCVVLFVSFLFCSVLLVSSWAPP